MIAVRQLLHWSLSIGAVALIVFGAGAQAKPYNVLHSFGGGNDGSGPFTPPVLADSGILYGTTNSGGAANSGTIYQIAPDGTETVLHSFDGASGGKTPDAAPTIDPASGALYGSTGFGGIGNGYGILWKLTARGKFTVLHDFNENGDGGGPQGQFIRDAMGNLYGVASGGGANFGGTVFRYGADGKFTVLHTFSEEDGVNPQGTLIRDRAGNLYGVTGNDGPNFGGTVYKLAPGGTYTVLHSFTTEDGALPLGGLARDKAGNLYGTTGDYGSGGYGTAFKLAPDGKFTVLHAFTGKADGGYPQGDLLRVGKELFGTTGIGGAKNCLCGVVFKIAMDGTETVLHAFTAGPDDGGTPFGGVAKGKHGLLYGTTGAGGANNEGIVFSVKKKQ